MSVELTVTSAKNLERTIRLTPLGRASVCRRGTLSELNSCFLLIAAFLNPRW